MIKVDILDDGNIIAYNNTIADSVMFEKISFKFSDTWNGYAKTAVFKNGKNTISVLLNSDSALCTGENECYVPYEVIKVPEFTVSVFGVSGDSRATTPQVTVSVKKSGYGEGDVPSEPTPGEYEQLVNLATETKQIAQSVRDDSEEAIASANTAANRANESANSATAAAANANKSASVAESSATTADAAAVNANTAATEANMATEKAGTAAINADTATVNANTATDNANTATSNAEKATAAANIAASVATNAAESANTAASDANTASSAAKDAAMSANSATDLAKSATASANTAAENAINAKNAAEEAATNANNATERSNTAAANAESIVTQANTTFANALKGTASGSAILIDDVSPVEHNMSVKVSSDTVTDLTTVKLTRCGKNLFDINSASKSSGYSYFSKEDNRISVSQVGSGQYISANIALPKNLEGKTVTVTAKANTSGVNIAWIRIQWSNPITGATTGDYLGSNYITGTTDTLLTMSGIVPAQPSSEYSELVLMLYSNRAGSGLSADGTYTATYSDIQLELGTTATDYEIGVTPMDYTPTADGTVEGVLSLYPNTTLITDTDGVTIDCEYNRDTNKAFEETIASANTAANRANESADSANAAAANANKASSVAEIAAMSANSATDLAQSAADTANTAAENAVNAKNAAEKAASDAKDAAERANTAAAQAEAVVEQAGELVTRYGVRFGGSANSGSTVQRLYNAVGLVAGVGTDTDTSQNDFDNIYPWSDIRRCCGYWGDDGNFVVNAYKGEPGYAVDGSNGEVWVEIPLFYYKHTYADGAEEIVISAFKLPGFMPSPINRDQGTEDAPAAKAYYPAYPMALVDEKPTSRSGVFNGIYSLNTAMADARKAGENYTVTTTAERYAICLLMWVEFATRNMQSVMNGAANLPYSANEVATVAEEGANRIIVSTATAAKFVVGQTIGIGTSNGSTNIANNRIVTAIEDYDDSNKAICFDGDPANVAAGNIVFTLAWINGSCDNVIASSGSPVSNTSGKYNCMYRGIERPYGDAFEWISDVLFKREGVGTAEDPYTYDVYFLPDPTKYANGAITDDYVKLNYGVPGADGYVKTLGFDSRYPWIRIPDAIGASATTYYSDYYYCPRSAICAARVGGNWNIGAGDGPLYWHCPNAPSSSNLGYRARLSYHR